MIDDKKKIFFGRSKSRALSKSKKFFYENHKKDFLVNFEEIKLIKNKDFVLEIGFGLGENLLFQASTYPKDYFIGVDPFINGVANVVQKAKFKFSAVFFGELEHKATITYDNTPEEQNLLDAILAKVLQTMPRTKSLKTYNKICEKQKNCSSHQEFNDLEIAKYKKPFCYLEVTKDEFHSWYEGWLDFYLNSDYALPISETYSQKWAKYSNDKTAIYKEAKRLLNSMYNIFGKLELDEESKLLLMESRQQEKEMGLA